MSAVKKYIVVASSVGGLGNRVFTENDQVTDKNFPEGHAELLVKQGFLKALDAKAQKAEEEKLAKEQAEKEAAEKAKQEAEELARLEAEEKLAKEQAEKAKQGNKNK